MQIRHANSADLSGDGNGNNPRSIDRWVPLPAIILSAAENATLHPSRKGSLASLMTAGAGDGPIRIEGMGRKIDG